MHDNDLENTFRDRFKNHKESINADEMIARLNLAEPKKKRRALVFWFFGILAGISIVTGILYLGDFEKSNDQSVAMNSATKQQISGVEVEPALKNTVEEENSSTVASKIEKLNSYVNISEESTQSTHEKNTSTTSKEAKSINNANSGSRNENLTLRSTYQVKPKITVSNMKGTQETIRGAHSPSFIENVVELSGQDIKVESELQFSPLSSQDISLFPDRADLQILATDLKINVPQKRQKIKHIPPPDFLEFYTAYHHSSRALTSSTDSYSEYVRERNENESQLEAVQAGLAFTKNLSRRFYISGGLEYTQINEQATLNYSTTTKTVDDNYPVLLQIQSNGDTIVNTGAADLYTVFFHQRSEYNNHKLITVPLNIGIQGKFDKLRWFVDAGVAIHFYAGFYGTMLNINQQVVSKPSYFTPKLAYGYRAAMGLAYPVSKKISLSVSTNFQNNLSSISDLTVISQTYILRGVRVGIRYEM